MNLLRTTGPLSFEEAEHNAARSPTLGLSARYVIALSVVAVLVVVGQVLIQVSLTRQESDSRTINVAGRQRMLSQKISKCALAVMNPRDPHSPAEHARILAADLELWRRSHHGLLNGDTQMRLSGQKSAAIAQLLVELQPYFDKMSAAASGLVIELEAGSASGPAAEQYAATILEYESQFLSKMDEIVFAYDEEAHARVTGMRHVEIVLTFAALFVLLLEALFIFRPAIKRLRRTLTALVTAKREFEDLAQHDGLTGIANRRAFDRFLDKECRRAGRGSHPLSVILVDIDHFKEYNECYGHQRGDECLQMVAAALDEQVKRPGDLVARYGGDEFVAVLPDTELEGALNVAESMKEAIRALRIEHAYPGIERHVSVSVGVASGVPRLPHVGADELLSAADDALFRVKRQSRDAIATVLIAAHESGEVSLGIGPSAVAGRQERA